MNRSVFDAQAASDITVDGLFRRAFRIFENRTAVTWEDGQRTYGEIGRRAWQLANALTRLGHTRGDRIAVLSEPRPEYVETYAALAALGIVVVTLNTRLHPNELRACIEKCRPSAVLFSGTLAPLVEPLRGTDRTLRDFIAFDPIEGAEDYEQLLLNSSDQAPEPCVSGPDIHNILFTSGTTGTPKGAVISQRAAAVRAARLAQWFGLTERDGFIGWLPMFHCAGDESLYATFLTGGIYATLKRVDMPTMYSMIERDRLTWTLLLPGVISQFLNHADREAHDLSSMRFAIGYANMMPQFVADLTRTCNIDFYDAFGQSEASYLIAHGRSGPGEMPSLRKTPSPLMEIRIVDDDMNELPVGEPGECVVRGPSVMSGYFEDEAATAEVFKHGWLHTGDVLKREADGSLTFVDRKRYLIKTGGENVYPAEVETIIAQHPAVAEVCVFGIADDLWGETIKAVVVLRPASNASIAQIDGWCREKLTGYKRPRFIQFVDNSELPRSTTGKVMRHLLPNLATTADQRTG